VALELKTLKPCLPWPANWPERIDAAFIYAYSYMQFAILIPIILPELEVTHLHIFE